MSEHPILGAELLAADTVRVLSDPGAIGWTRTALLGILAWGLLAGVVTGALAFGVRSATVRSVDRGPAILAGLAVPSTWLLVDLQQTGAVIAETSPTNAASGTYLLGVVSASILLAARGYRFGDHLACGAFDIERLETDGPAADRIRSAGHAVELSLPETIGDADGYSSVDPAVKRTLRDRTLLFPSQLRGSELHVRLQQRLETDFDVDCVDLELDEDGRVESLAVGRRPNGIGSTIPPDTVAVAVQTTCAQSASVGDPVEVWSIGEDSSRLVATGTLRARSGSVTTLVVAAADADAFTRGEQYRLTTRAEPSSDAAVLAAAIRTADETVTTVTVEPDGPLENEFLGWIPGTVLVLERDETVVSLPADNEPVRAGDSIYVLGTPADLRKVHESREIAHHPTEKGAKPARRRTR